MLTFTRHENPQSLADIMRTAWRMAKRAQFALCLRMAWAMARKAAGARMPEPPPSLSQFVRARGGLRPNTELRTAGIQLHMLSRGGLSLDDMARLATDAGYDVRDCPSELVDMLRDETFGARHYSQGDQSAAHDYEAWMQFVEEREQSTIQLE